MKKQYQKPTVVVQKITPYELICSSIRGINGANGIGLSDKGTYEDGIITGNSRRSYIWDDDEEYDY